MTDILSYGPTSDQEIQQQANVTINIGRPTTAVQDLRFLISSRAEGTYIDGPLDAGCASVDRMDLIFCRVTGRDAKSKRKGTIDYSIDTFSSFNGQIFDRGCTQQEFERQFKFLGIATGVQDFTGDMPSKQGFAAVCAGSMSAKNISNTTFFPGDLVGWCAPHVNKAKRAEQYKSVQFGNLDAHISPVNKHTATLKRITASDIVEQWSDVAELLLNDFEEFSVHKVRRTILRGALPKVVTEEQMASIWLKQFISLVSYQTLVAAHQHGIITPDPVLVAEPSDPQLQDYITNREKVANEGWLKINGENGNARNDAARRTFSNEVNNFAVNMARATGLISPGNSVVTEDHGLLRRILRRVLYSNISAIEDLDDYTKRISDEFNTFIGNLPDVFGNVSSSNPSIPLQMLHVKGDALRSLYRSIVSNAFSFTDKVVGTASNTSRPGTLIHLVLSS